MGKIDLSLEEYKALSDEEREIVRLESAEAYLRERIRIVTAEISTDDARNAPAQDGIIQALAQEMKTDDVSAEAALGALRKVIAREMSQNKRTTLPGIGTFSKSVIPAQGAVVSHQVIDGEAIPATAQVHAKPVVRVEFQIAESLIESLGQQTE